MPPSIKVALFIDPPSYHFRDDGLFDLNNAKLIGDNLLAPYAYLRDYFAARGVPVHTSDRLIRGDLCAAQNLYISLGIRDNYRALAKRSDVILSAFFAVECPIVEPCLYRELNRVQRYFKRLFSWSDSASLQPFVGRNLRCEKFYWPQSFEQVHDQIWGNSQRKFLVMINANKLPKLYRQELYTERLRAVEFFSRRDEIDLYGVGWDGPPYHMGKSLLPATLRRVYREWVRQWQRLRPNPIFQVARRVYKGPAVSKSAVLGQYTFAVCFENMILKGWITEKIFDCFFSGTIPIYWGAPDIEQYVPPECFIDMRQFGDYAELRSYLKSLSEKEIREYKENAKGYLSSPKFSPFTRKAFAELFRRMIEEDSGTRLL